MSKVYRVVPGSSSGSESASSGPKACGSFHRINRVERTVIVPSRESSLDRRLHIQLRQGFSVARGEATERRSKVSDCIPNLWVAHSPPGARRRRAGGGRAGIRYQSSFSITGKCRARPPSESESLRDHSWSEGFIAGSLVSRDSYKRCQMKRKGFLNPGSSYRMVEYGRECGRAQG